MTKTKNRIVYIVSVFSAIGGFLIGYYAGVISGVLIMQNFRNTTLETSSKNSTGIFEENILEHRTGVITGILLIGSFFGAIIGGEASDRFSRKYSISAFSFLLTISSVLQAVSWTYIFLVIVRFFAGISLGALSMIIPVYHSEIAATQVRGRLIAIQNCAIGFGIAISSWINVGMFLADETTSENWPWRIPFGLQTIPSLILSVGILFCPFSPRWLISRDREDEAQKILINIRSSCYDDIKEELDRIKNEVAYLRENEIESYRQLFRPPLRRLFLMGMSIQILQQLTGISGTISYSPQVFTRIFSNETAPFPFIPTYLPITVSAIYGSIYFLTAAITIFFIDKLSRRVLLVTGGLVMFISLLLIGIFMVAFGTAVPSPYRNVTIYDYNSASLRTVLIVLMHIYVIGFSCSWGPIPWAYCTEIFPVTMRAKATSWTTAANWLTSSIATYAAPFLLVYLPYGTFFIFSFLCGLMAVISFFFYPDTKHMHLEDSQRIFTLTSSQKLDAN